MEEKIIAVVKYPYKKAKTVELEKGLEPLQNIVDGYIEAAALPDIEGITGYCNKEGLIKGMDPNFYRPEWKDAIFGPVVVVGIDDEGNDISLTPQQVEKVTEYLTANSATNFDELLKNVAKNFADYMSKEVKKSVGQAENESIYRKPKMEDKIIAVVKFPFKKAETKKIEKGIDALEDCVGGYTETLNIPGMEEIIGYCNEVSLLVGFDPNFYVPEWKDAVCGPVVFISRDDEGEYISLTPEQVEEVTDYLTVNSVESEEELMHYVETDFANYKPKEDEKSVGQAENDSIYRKPSEMKSIKENGLKEKKQVVPKSVPIMESKGGNEK